MSAQKESLTHNIYQKLKELIIYNSLQPGDLITVNELAVRFNVSKTPIRDGLNALKHEGLVEVLPYKGFLVSRIDLAELVDLFKMRMILESAAVEMAAQNASQELITELIHLADKMPVDKDNGEFMLTNYQFHTAIAKASGNQYLVKYLSNVLNQLQRVLYTDLSQGDPLLMQREHQELVQCIRDRNSNKAKDRMMEQLTQTRKRLFKTMS